MVPEGEQVSKEDGLASYRIGKSEQEPEPGTQCCLWTMVP